MYQLYRGSGIDPAPSLLGVAKPQVQYVELRLYSRLASTQNINLVSFTSRCVKGKVSLTSTSSVEELENAPQMIM
jgi:hypothetical protein